MSVDEVKEKQGDGAVSVRGAVSQRNGTTEISREGSPSPQAVGLIGYSKQDLFKTYQACCLVLFLCPERAGARGLGNHSSIRTLHGPQGREQEDPCPIWESPASPPPHKLPATKLAAY